jgi:transmembrane sensor
MAEQSHKSTRAIIEEATQWLVLLADPEVSEGDDRKFAEWLRRSPQHVKEFLRAEATMAALGEFDKQRSIDIEAILRRSETNVVALGEQAAEPLRHQTPKSWRYMGSVRGIAAILLLGVTLSWVFLTPDSVRYDTGLGEQRRLVLDDGSVIELNTQSVIEVQLDKYIRAVQLLEGEVLFTVAKDPNRPFVVTSDMVEVRALGTQFNVYRQPDHTLVTVLEGRVAVQNIEQRSGVGTDAGDDSDPEPAFIEVGVGEQARVAGNRLVLEAETHPERTVAWRELRLIFENEPLSEVLREFNRYNTRQLIIHDEALAAERVSGVFDADQPDALVQFLTRYASIEVITDSDSKLEIRPQK